MKHDSSVNPSEFIEMISQLDPRKDEKLILEIIGELYSKLGDFKVAEKIKEGFKPEVGLKTTFEKRFTYADVFLFSLLSGDWNVIHHNEELAGKTKFGGRVVHGLLTTSLASALMEMFPGIVVLLGVEFQYTKPVYIGDTVRGEAVITEMLSKNRFKVAVNFTNAKNEVVAKGSCMILVWEPVTP
jgi:3-hydroxybutyryl-CoA dehydratase